MKDIFHPVGAGGVNDTDDVFMVQMLLNHVPDEAGGPIPKLEVDGRVGPLTRAAINRFQKHQLSFQDGLVEPGRKTITRLNAFFRQPAAFSTNTSSDKWCVASTGGVPAKSPFHLIYRDVRLEGWKPKGNEVIDVNFDTPLLWFITSGVKCAAKNSNNVRLRIMAHGYPGPGGSQGGGGVQFCKEDINLTTVEWLQPLYGKFKDGVDLYVCGTAFITPGHEGKQGDGNLLCSRMAQVLNTYVRASTATQGYSYGTAATGLDFGRWEGTVLTYGPKGDVVNVEEAPPF